MTRTNGSTSRVRPTSSTTARRRRSPASGCCRRPATRGHQSVLVDTPDGLVVIGGDVAYTFDELGSGATEGQRRVLALAAPTWLTHADGGPESSSPELDA